MSPLERLDGFPEPERTDRDQVEEGRDLTIVINIVVAHAVERRPRRTRIREAIKDLPDCGADLFKQEYGRMLAERETTEELAESRRLADFLGVRSYRHFERLFS